MRRLVATAASALALFCTTSTADAQSATTFSSPTRAVAGAPMFVRSVTPCPATFGSVLVEILGQLEDTAVESTHADVAPDGSWVVTVSAPSDMAAGITKSYRVRPTCSAGAVAYGTRRLYVTGFGATSASASPSDGTTSEATATTAAPSSSLVLSSAGLKRTTSAPEPIVTAAAEEPATTTTTWTSDEKERAAEARAELAAKVQRKSVSLRAEQVAATTAKPEADGGIPWWSFVLATMLAVGAVVGYGQRRRPSLLDD